MISIDHKTNWVTDICSWTIETSHSFEIVHAFPLLQRKSLPVLYDLSNSEFIVWKISSPNCGKWKTRKENVWMLPEIKFCPLYILLTIVMFDEAIFNRFKMTDREQNKPVARECRETVVK